jgi:hypothetical protein
MTADNDHHKEDKMRGQEAIKSLCKLVSQVGEEVFKNQRAHDCLCGGKHHVQEKNAVVDEGVIDFITCAVRSAIEERVKCFGIKDNLQVNLEKLVWDIMDSHIRDYHDWPSTHD